MAWISYDGRTGASSLANRGSRYKIDNEPNSDDEGDSSPCKAVPLCGGPGLPSKRLPRPGIDCVNGDRPCLPCDIVNVRLRVAVTGSKVKRAVAECQKRYFCSVWNLLFAYLFPGEHQDGPCPNVQPNDPLTLCRGQERPQKSSFRRREQNLPIGPFDPSNAKEIQMNDHLVQRLLPQREKLLAPLPLPKAPTRLGNLRYNLIDTPYMATDKLKSHRIRRTTPAQNKRLRRNFYDLPTLDSQK